MAIKDLNTLFFDTLKSNCTKNISFIEEVAEVLDINYDAAYRRINNKTSLSLVEAIKLATHFKISIDNQILSQNLDQNKLIVRDSADMSTFEGIENYFDAFLNNQKTIENKNETHIIYNAKDLPLFYFAKDPLFAKFKIYTMLYLFNKNFSQENITFNSFILPKSLEEKVKKFGEIYYEFDITEIWNNNILDATINQILYFYELKIILYNTAISLCDKLIQIIKQIEKDSFSGVRNNTSKSVLNIYNSPLLLLNNNVVIQTKHKNILLLPYILAKYFYIEDQRFIHKYINIINEELKLATLLSKAGVKERLTFFKMKYKTIEKAKQHIELFRHFPL
ncbi:MAG TPA: hypothetical protein ENK67_04900 [Flavobacteriia bacterium]|nr:hypothetical protein [Flavobacteriia bacterium]